LSKKNFEDRFSGEKKVAPPFKVNPSIIGAVLFALLIIGVILEFNPLGGVKDSTGVDPNKKYISTDFAATEDYYKSLTQVQQKEYMSRVEGGLVRWTGKVDDVTDTSIYLAAGKYGVVRNLEVKLSNTETIDRKKLFKGQELTIEGRLSNVGGVLTNWRVVEANIVK